MEDENLIKYRAKEFLKAFVAPHESSDNDDKHYIKALKNIRRMTNNFIAAGGYDPHGIVYSCYSAANDVLGSVKDGDHAL